MANIRPKDLPSVSTPDPADRLLLDGASARSIDVDDFYNAVIQSDPQIAGFSTKNPPSGVVVGDTDAQTLTNKTIDGDNNTLVDIPYSALDSMSTLIQKTTPSESDEVLLADNAAGGILKRTPVSSLPSSGTAAAQPVYNITLAPFNARADYAISLTATMGAASPVLLTPSPQFTPADVGKYIIVKAAGASGGNLVSTIQSYTNSQNITLAHSNASGGTVSNTQIEYGTDDAPALNAAIVAAKNARGGTIYIPVGSYLVSQIDLTNCGWAITIRGEGVSSSALMPMQNAISGTVQGHVIDLTGSSQLTLDNIQIGSFQTLATATCALFFGQTNANGANRVRIRNLYVSGQYSGATVYIYGTPSFEFWASDFYNYKPGAGGHGVMTLTRTNVLGYTSQFMSIATGAWNMSDVHFFQCEFHKFAATGASNWVIYMEGASNISFYGGVINGGATAYCWYENVNAHISYFNTTFENEGPPTVTIPIYGHYKNSGTITDLIDPGCSYGYSSGKFNIVPASANVVSYSL